MQRVKRNSKKNLIPRDLKPNSLFLDNNKALKMGDFGISNQLSSNNKYATSNVGTSNYCKNRKNHFRNSPPPS